MPTWHFGNVKFDTCAREVDMRDNWTANTPVLLSYTWLTSLLVFWRNAASFLSPRPQRQCTESSVKTECEYRMLGKYPTAKIIFPLSLLLSFLFSLFFSILPVLFLPISPRWPTVLSLLSRARSCKSPERLRFRERKVDFIRRRRAERGGGRRKVQRGN